MLDKIISIINLVPGLNLVPVVTSILTDLPKAWENLPEEKKQEYLQAFIAAGAKAASQYAGS